MRPQPHKVLASKQDNTGRSGPLGAPVRWLFHFDIRPVGTFQKMSDLITVRGQAPLGRASRIAV